MKYFLLILFLFVITSCSSEEKTKLQSDNSSPKSGLKVKAEKLLGNEYSTIYNSNKDFVICLEKVDGDNSSKFFIYDIEADSIVFRDNLINGEIKWINEYDFSVIEYPGIVKKNDQSVKSKYSYNVLRKKKNN